MITLLLATALAQVPNLDEPLRTGATEPNDVALVIGNEDYAFVPDVPYAANDARTFADWLVYTRGVPANRVETLVGAGREQVLAAARRAAGRATSESVIWVYFAGHGAADPGSGERLLLGDDVKQDPAVFATRAVAVDELSRAVSTRGGQVVMVLDTCYTGHGRGGESLVSGARFMVPEYATKRPDVVEWAAASPDELSGPLHATGHGAFTWLALGALRGWADGELDGAQDGAVTLDEAQIFVARTLRDLGINRQHPALLGTAGQRNIVAVKGDLADSPPAEVLAALPAADAVPIDEAGPSLDDVLAQELELEVQRLWQETARVALTGTGEGRSALERFVEHLGDVKIRGEEPQQLTIARRLLKDYEDPAQSPFLDQLGLEMIRVEPGSVWDSGGNEWQISRPLYLASHEVTQELWHKVEDVEPDTKPLHPKIASFRAALEFCNRLSEREGLIPAYDLSGKEPVWNLLSNGYRLPSRVEWELGARAGTESRFVWTSDVNELCKMENTFVPEQDCQRKGMEPVGGYAPNPLGLFDVLGNAGEWVWPIFNRAEQGKNYVGLMGIDPLQRKSLEGGILMGAFDYGPHIGGFSTGNRRDSFTGMRLARSPWGLAIRAEHLQVAAERAWEATFALALAGGPKAREALRSFLLRYRHAAVVEDGDVRAVELHQVRWAEAWLRSLDRPSPSEAYGHVTLDAAGYQMERLEPKGLAPFMLGRTEVSQTLWAVLTGETPSDCAAGCGPDFPVQSVNVEKMARFCNQLSALEGLVPAYEFIEIEGEEKAHWLPWASGYRLPRHAEWKAAIELHPPKSEYYGNEGKAWPIGSGDEFEHLLGNLRDAVWLDHPAKSGGPGH
ncbi:MAG: SUMF1/EgtB/PvdO family nonheme iron enzyme, partial [Proteobacteria bacterium]|nr:SUMF1/EgtB/PvdO family nonheme iron enzyme [Pseudomonadota bacterium]